MYNSLLVYIPTKEGLWWELGWRKSFWEMIQETGKNEEHEMGKGKKPEKDVLMLVAAVSNRSSIPLKNHG